MSCSKFHQVAPNSKVALNKKSCQKDAPNSKSCKKDAEQLVVEAKPTYAHLLFNP